MSGVFHAKLAINRRPMGDWEQFAVLVPPPPRRPLAVEGTAPGRRFVLRQQQKNRRLQLFYILCFNIYFLTSNPCILGYLDISWVFVKTEYAVCEGRQ